MRNFIYALMLCAFGVMQVAIVAAELSPVKVSGAWTAVAARVQLAA